MNRWKKVIQIADHTFNLLIVVCFLPILLYGVYAIWDSGQLYNQADASLYETYRPSKDDISFEELKKINPEVFGWLILDKTHIDYPLVQATDNSKYVNTDVKGEFSLSGSIFLDYRNKNDFSDINNIIYGHHMQKDKMFGELEYFDEKTYFDEHRYGQLYYDDKWHEVEFFAFLHADAYDSVLYNTEFQGNAGGQTYLNYVRKNAKNFRELHFKPDEHYVALSTCTSSSTNGRHILVGRITEKTAKNPSFRQMDSDKK